MQRAWLGSRTRAEMAGASRARRPLGVRPSTRDWLQRSIGNEAMQGLTGSIDAAMRAGSSIVADVIRSPGQPLPSSVRADMEQRFGEDFSGVEIHVGDEAEHSAAGVKANAYTLGRHIVFGRGRYSPETSTGWELLAHELAHVVQQGRGGVAPSSDTAESSIEHDAQQAAVAAVHGGGPVHVESASGVGIARQEDDDSFNERVRRELHDEILRELFPTRSSTGGGDAPQANLPLLSILNGPFFGGNNPIGTLSTDIFLAPSVQSTTDPSVGPTWPLSFTLQVRDRLSAESELGAFWSLGHVFRQGTTTNALGLTYHHGPEAPSEGSRFGLGYWLTLAQTWGLEPPTQGQVAPSGWSFNPTANAFLSLGWARAEESEADLIFGLAGSRWGQVNAVPVGGFLNPYVGFSYTRQNPFGLGEDLSAFAEITGGPYLGLAGRYDVGTGFPVSLFVSGGAGFQYTRGDYGIGIEPWIFAEPWSSVSAPGGGPSGNIGGGLRFNLTAINPRRRHLLDE